MKHILIIISTVILIASCGTKDDDITGIGISAVSREYLSSKIDSNFVIKFTNLAPEYRTLKRIEVKNPNGESWGVAELIDGTGYITLKRDSIENYTHKVGGAYQLTNANEIAAHGFNFITLDNLKASSVATLLISPSVTFSLNADIVNAATGNDTTRNITSLMQSDEPVYFRYTIKSSDIDNPDYNVNMIISLMSQNMGNTTLRNRQYSMITDTIMFRGSDYGLNDRINLRIRCSAGSGYSDDVSSVQFTVNPWTFQNDLADRLLTQYFNLSNGRGIEEPETSPYVQYDGNGSLTLVSNNDTILSAVKFTGYKYADRNVDNVKTKYTTGSKGTTFTVAPNDAVGIRLAYTNSKGMQEYSWAVMYINSVNNVGTPDENIIFSYQYKPRTY